MPGCEYYRMDEEERVYDSDWGKVVEEQSRRKTKEKEEQSTRKTKETEEQSTRKTKEAGPPSTRKTKETQEQSARAKRCQKHSPLKATDSSHVSCFAYKTNEILRKVTFA